jgi:hypothetical protein
MAIGSYSILINRCDVHCGCSLKRSSEQDHASLLFGTFARATSSSPEGCVAVRAKARCSGRHSTTRRDSTCCTIRDTREHSPSDVRGGEKTSAVARQRTSCRAKSGLHCIGTSTRATSLGSSTSEIRNDCWSVRRRMARIAARAHLAKVLRCCKASLSAVSAGSE